MHLKINIYVGSLVRLKRRRQEEENKGFQELECSLHNYNIDNYLFSDQNMPNLSSTTTVLGYGLALYTYACTSWLAPSVFLYNYENRQKIIYSNIAYFYTKGSLDCISINS